MTLTATFTLTSTATSVNTLTPAPTLTATVTGTPYPTGFFVDKNLFYPPQQSVSIRVSVNSYPGEYTVRIYNTAGEVVRNLTKLEYGSPNTNTYPWDGKNDYGEICASGVYIIYLTEPYERHLAKVLLLR